jgi:DNA-binding LacI/PurR family transcriptional regulator
MCFCESGFRRGGRGEEERESLDREEAGSIREDRMMPATPTMTLTRIAAMAKTSPSTVSRVLSNDPRISDVTRERVLEILKENRYQPNVFARALKGGKTGQIGVLATNIGSGFFAEVLQGVDFATRSRAVHMVCSFAHGIEDYMEMATDMLTSGRTDGAILIDPPLELFESAVPPGAAPSVLCASRPLRRSSAWDRVDSVTVDNNDAMKQLVGQMAGRRRACFMHLAGPHNTYDSQARRAAFKAAMRGRKGWRAVIEDGHLIEGDGRRAAKQMLTCGRPLPDAILCFNDSTAQGVVETFDAEGLAWQGRVAITGWDNSTAAHFMDLTSVQMPTQDLGRKAAELLLDHLKPGGLNGPARQIALPTTIYYRGSTQRRGKAP